MGLQIIKLALNDRDPLFPPNQCTLGEGIWRQRAAPPIAADTADPLPGRGTLEGSRAAGSILRRGSISSGVCVLGLLIGAAGDTGLCSSSNLTAQALGGSTEQARKITKPYAVSDDSVAVSQVDKKTFVEQKQVTESGREQVDTHRLNAAQGIAAQFTAAGERRQVVEHAQEWDKAEALARALTSSLRGEVAAVRSAAEAERIKQKERLDKERDRANALARELDSLRAELDGARRVSQEAAQASEAELKQREVLEQERGRTDSLARQVTSLQAELDAARNVGAKAAQASEAESQQREALEQARGRADTFARQVTSLRAELDAERTAGAKAAQTAEAEIKQSEALEEGLKQERGKAAALASELTSVRAELDQARAASLAAARATEAATTEQQKERAKAEALARELDSARKQTEERSTLLAAAQAEVLEVKRTNSAYAAKQQVALASERDRADSLGRELNSLRNQLETSNKQIAALNALLAQHSGKAAADSSAARIAGFSSTKIEKEEPSKQQISGGAAPSSSESLQSARQALAPSAPLASELDQAPSASAVTHSPVNEQRLLARAIALLQQADISGARRVLEHAVEHGSARAAYMLAETYDARVLQAWRARGISGDPAKARQLYERAQAGGIEGASGRIDGLQ